MPTDAAPTDAPAWPDSHWLASAGPPLDCAPLRGEAEAEVAIVGAGYAGLNAALELAEMHGISAVVLEAAQPGWGASGRNGGFCCLGGTMLDKGRMARRHGPRAAADWARYEHDAIARVRDNLARYAIDADVGPSGEIKLAHSPRALAVMRAKAAPERRVIEATDLAAHGFGGRFHGGILNPAGFPLHPLKYAHGLARAALDAGVRLHGKSVVRRLERARQGWRLVTEKGALHARRVLWATNGYSPEQMLPWLKGRLLPFNSAILVTRPLSQAELAAQGWTSQVMAYDSRRLLHYFRLLPCGRFLFGGRGGASGTLQGEAAFAPVLRAEFAALFPAWADVGIERYWGGNVCLTGSGLPWCGAVPDQPGLHAALGWHGNGVAAASEGGRRIAPALAGGENAAPALLQRRPGRSVPPALRPLAVRAFLALSRMADGPVRR